MDKNVYYSPEVSTQCLLTENECVTFFKFPRFQLPLELDESLGKYLLKKHDFFSQEI